MGNCWYNLLFCCDTNQERDESRTQSIGVVLVAKTENCLTSKHEKEFAAHWCRLNVLVQRAPGPASRRAPSAMVQQHLTLVGARRYESQRAWRRRRRLTLTACHCDQTRTVYFISFHSIIQHDDDYDERVELQYGIN